MRTEENILSVFIDESGDFGEYNYHSPYYMVSMVLHEQKNDLSNEIRFLDKRISVLGFPIHAIHAGPLIRREDFYFRYSDFEKRKSLFNAMYQFTRKCNIRYISPYIRKSECSDFLQMKAKLSKAILMELNRNFEYFNSFDKIIIYYDNGQNELTKILTSVFNILFSNIEFRKVSPSDYKLFQTADMICTLELLALKAEHNQFTKSEREFFTSERDFKKCRLKEIRKKRI